MNHENPDPRFRAWLSEQAPRRAPDELLHQAMQGVDGAPQGRGWTLRWPVLRFAVPAVAAAVMLVIAVGTGVLLLNLRPTVGPEGSSTPGPSTTAAASATPLASVGPLEAVVVARIALPHPYAQTAFDDQVAVTDDAIWIASLGGEATLTRIDVTSNQVASDVTTGPALLSAGDVGLWMLSPWGGIPGPATMDLSRVDLQTGQPQLVAEVPPNVRMAVGQGGVWLADGDLRLLDAASGEVIRAFGQPPNGISIACGALWGWDLPPSENDLQWTLSRLDPETGKRLDQIRLPDGVRQGLTEIDGLCWTYAGGELYGISPRDGSVISSTVPRTSKLQVAGDTLWNTTASGLIQRVDPRTGTATGEAWQLPSEDLHRDPKGQADWRLLSAGGSLWLLGGDRVVRYDIPTAGEPPTPAGISVGVENDDPEQYRIVWSDGTTWREWAVPGSTTGSIRIAGAGSGELKVTMDDCSAVALWSVEPGSFLVKVVGGFATLAEGTVSAVRQLDEIQPCPHEGP